jgi:putative ABC transport system permease protein
VLSQSTARKYFGEIDPSGKLIRLNDSTTLSVTGVYQDLPHYSHLDFEMVFSKRARCLTPIDWEGVEALTVQGV